MDPGKERNFGKAKAKPICLYLLSNGSVCINGNRLSRNPGDGMGISPVCERSSGLLGGVKGCNRMSLPENFIV